METPQKVTGPKRKT